MIDGGPLEKPGHMDGDAYVSAFIDAYKAEKLDEAAKHGLKLTKDLQILLNGKLNPINNKRLASALEAPAGFAIHDDITLLLEAVTGMTGAFESKNYEELKHIAKWYSSQTKRKPLFADAYQINYEFGDEVLEDVKNFSKIANYIAKIGSKSK